MHEPIFSQASTPRLLTAGCDVEDEEEEGQLLAPVPELDLEEGPGRVVPPPPSPPRRGHCLYQGAGAPPPPSFAIRLSHALRQRRALGSCTISQKPVSSQLRFGFLALQSRDEKLGSPTTAANGYRKPNCHSSSQESQPKDTQSKKDDLSSAGRIMAPPVAQDGKGAH